MKIKDIMTADVRTVRSRPPVERTVTVTPSASWLKPTSSELNRTVTPGVASAIWRRSGSSVYWDIS